MGEYSLKDLASAIEFDIIDYIPLLELFVKTTESDLDKIGSGIEAVNRSSISECLHNIRGASLNLGLTRICSIVDDMRQMNNDGDMEKLSEKLLVCYSETVKLRNLIGESE